MGATISPPIQDVYQIKADTAEVVTHTGDIVETTLKSHTIPGGTLGHNGAIRIKATGLSMGNNGTKLYRLKFATLLIGNITVAADAAAKFWTLLAAGHHKEVGDEQSWSIFWIDEATIAQNKTGEGTGVNMDDDQVLELTVQLANLADSCEALDWTIEINPAG